MEAQQAIRKIQNGISNMVENVDKRLMRPIYRDTYTKIAKCYDNKSATSLEVDSCVESNAKLLQSYNTMVNSHISDYQHRLERCIQTCEDESTDYSNGSSKNNDNSSFQGDIQDRCVCLCVDKQYEKLGGLQARIEQDINELFRKR